jgi:hypothetical protein
MPAGRDMLRFFKARSEVAIPAVVLPERGTQKNRQSTPALRVAAIPKNKGKSDGFDVFAEAYLPTQRRHEVRQA